MPCLSCFSKLHKLAAENLISSFLGDSGRGGEVQSQWSPADVHQTAGVCSSSLQTAARGDWRSHIQVLMLSRRQIYSKLDHRSSSSLLYFASIRKKVCFHLWSYWAYRILAVWSSSKITQLQTRQYLFILVLVIHSCNYYALFTPQMRTFSAIKSLGRESRGL